MNAARMGSMPSLGVKTSAASFVDSLDAQTGTVDVS